MLTQKTAQALRAAVEAAAICPEMFDMDFWARIDDCKTTLCLAGNMLVLEGWQPVKDRTSPVCYHFFRRGDIESVYDLMEETYGINTDEWIFHANEWPGDLEERYDNALDHTTRVQITRLAVERYIAQQGVEPKQQENTITHESTEPTGRDRTTQRSQR